MRGGELRELAVSVYINFATSDDDDNTQKQAGSLAAVQKSRYLGGGVRVMGYGHMFAIKFA
jgi:hypothetical protein